MYYTSKADLTLQKDKSSAAKPVRKALPVLPGVSRLEVTEIKPVISPSGDSIVTEVAWMHDQLVFDGEKFEALARRLGRWYNVQIRINDKQVENYTFSGIFEGETIEQALKELQMIRPFHFVINRDKVEISK